MGVKSFYTKDASPPHTHFVLLQSAMIMAYTSTWRSSLARSHVARNAVCTGEGKIQQRRNVPVFLSFLSGSRVQNLVQGWALGSTGE